MNEFVINNRESLIKRITASLTGYVGYVRTLSKENFNDNAVLAETEFMRLLNYVYGLNLINANIVKHNTPGFDLIDKEHKIIVQVSVSDTRDKINHTLDVLNAYQQLYDGYHLLFFFISTDTFKLRSGSGYQGIPVFLSFDYKTDILDVESLNQKIVVLRDEQLEKVVCLSSRIFDIFPFFDKNKDYQNKRNQLDTVITELFNVSSYLNHTPDNEYLKERQRVLSTTRQSLEEQLFEDAQHILALAKQIAELKGQQISKRLQRAIEAFEDGDITKAETILEEAEKEIDTNNQSVDQILRATVFQNIEELRLKTSVTMAKIDIPIRNRIHDTLILWHKIDDSVLKYNYADYEPDRNDELLGSYYDFLQQYGYYQDALIIQERLLQLREARFGEEHEKTAESYNNLGCLHIHLDQYFQALSFLEKAVVICEKVLGTEHPDTASSYNNIGSVYDDMGDFSKALEYHEKALEISKKVLGSEHPDTATSYNNIGKVYDNLGEYTKALEYYMRDMAINEKVLGPKHLHTASSYNNIGVVYRKLEEYTKALEYHEKALGIVEKVLGTEHPSAASLYNNIGLVYINKDEYTKAREYFVKALVIREKVLGTEYPDTAQSYNNIGGIYDNMGNYTKALEYYEKALAIYERVLGTEHPDTANSYYNIGGVYDSMGEFPKALEYLEKALIIVKKALGPNHPYTKDVKLSIEILKSKISG